MIKTIAALLLLALASCGVKNVGSSVATQTTAVLHIYANGTSGNDTWDGSAAANTGGTLIGPKKSLSAVFFLVPDLVKHNVVVHLAGTFSEGDAMGSLHRMLTNNATIIVDGGTGLTTFADNGGNPWTADIHETTSIGLTTAGWTVDAYAGYIVEVIDGPAAGQNRLIQANSTTTITPVRNFSVDPGAASFRISRPTTTLTSSSAYAYFYVGGSSANGSLGTIYERTNIQNLYLAGSKMIFTASNSDAIAVSHIVDNRSGGWSNFLSCYNTLVGLPYRYNVSTFALESANTFSAVGIGAVGSATWSVRDGRPSGIGGASYFNTAAAFSVVGTRVGVGIFNSGPRFKSLTVSACNVDTATPNAINSAGWASTTIGGGTVGITLRDSSFSIGTGVVVGGSSSHGIEVNHSRLHLDGAVTGTGNGGCGVYAHSGSIVQIKDGAPPTLTGTLAGGCDFSIDGTTQKSTWAAIDGGAPASDSVEMTLAKQVP